MNICVVLLAKLQTLYGTALSLVVTLYFPLFCSGSSPKPYIALSCHVSLVCSNL